MTSNVKPPITSLSHEKLAIALERKSYDFCVNADFENRKAIIALCDRMEQYSTEALMRIFESKLGYRPYQNRIYDEVEKIFDNQDSYNINRAFSCMRRTKYFNGIDPENIKYQNWFKNRVRYGFKAIIEALEEVMYAEIPSTSSTSDDQEEVQEFVHV